VTPSLQFSDHAALYLQWAFFRRCWAAFLNLYLYLQALLFVSRTLSTPSSIEPTGLTPEGNAIAGQTKKIVTDRIATDRSIYGSPHSTGDALKRPPLLRLSNLSVCLPFNRPGFLEVAQTVRKDRWIPRTTIPFPSQRPQPIHDARFSAMPIGCFSRPIKPGAGLFVKFQIQAKSIPKISRRVALRHSDAFSPITQILSRRFQLG
jgi:hypothetical protein